MEEKGLFGFFLWKIGSCGEGGEGSFEKKGSVVCGGSWAEKKTCILRVYLRGLRAKIQRLVLIKIQNIKV